MRFHTLALVLLPAAALVAADIKFTKPTRDTTYPAGETITLEWEDSGDGPGLSDFTTYTLWLCMGSNAEPHCDYTIGTVASVFAPGMTEARTVVDPKYGENVRNVYFIKMESVAKTGGSTINYTPRFSMSGMTGDFTPAQLVAQKVGDEPPPASVNAVVDITTQDSSEGEKLGEVPYTLQTGSTMYAPMQSQPGKSITATAPRRQYPTSAYTVFTTKGPKPEKETTVTLPWDYTVHSRINTAAPQPGPHDEAMQRFLNRWRD